MGKGNQCDWNILIDKSMPRCKMIEATYEIIHKHSKNFLLTLNKYL
jgi:hypothetical protein